MNERIKELAVNAGVTFDWDPDTAGPEVYFDRQEDFEKFAELIIKECAELCTDSYHLGDAGTGTGFGITTADARCAELIKKHFGVKQ